MMEVLVFKTNIWGEHQEKSLHKIFSKSRDIISWSVDREDIDNVLRIVSSGRTNEKDIIELVTYNGYACDVLE